MPTNTIITPDEIANELLRHLHQKSVFLSTINRQYSDEFKDDGAKKGDSVRIKSPAQYSVRTGATFAAQNYVEETQLLTLGDQVGIDVEFTTRELSRSLNELSETRLKHMASRLVSHLEAEAMKMFLDVPNIVDGDTQALSLNHIALGGGQLSDELADMDDRTALLSTKHNVAIVDALKGNFNDPDELSKQYKKGIMGDAAGFTFAQSSLVLDRTTGTAPKTSGHLVAGAAQVGSSVTIDNGSGAAHTTTFVKGDIVTMGINRVHPETKADTGVLRTFVVTATTTSGVSTSISIFPPIVVSGTLQNVTGSPADNAPIVKVAAGNIEKYNSSMVYHKDAFTMATADLMIPRGVHFAARKNYEGVSLRVIEQYDVRADTIPCRIDVLPAFKAIRPLWACRIHADG